MAPSLSRIAPRRAPRLGLAAALSTVALACGEADETGSPGVTAPGRTETLAAGDYLLRAETGAREVTLLRGETTLLRFSADGFDLGTVEALDDGTNYDPYRLYAPHALYQPPEITWHSVTSMAIGTVTDASLELALSYDGGKAASLRFEALRPGGFEAHLVPGEAGAPTAYFRLRPRVDAEEAFYGLGEYFDEVNHRGKVRAMQIELVPELESSYNEAHVPVPFVIGTLGWGLFVENPYPGVFAVATEADDAIDAAFGTGLASAEGLRFHLFGAEHPLDVTRHYYEVTGYPRLPARWALGPWVWRDESKDQAQAESDANFIRDLDLATTGYWIDRPYATGVNTFDFAASMFTDPQAMIDTLHGLGLRVALWHTPYLDEGDPSTQALRDEANEQGYYPETVGLLLNGWGKPIDLTNPDAFAWWQGLIRRYTDMGIEGFKMDYGEDVAVGLSTARNVWEFSDGSDERTMHALFQHVYHAVYVETLPDEGGFLLCRGGSYGDQVNSNVIWPGDLDASFAKHGELVSENGDEYVAVGGLPASVVAGLSLGPSGFPFYGADTGGYRHSPPDKEVFTRWFEQTALSTVMQIGTSTNDVAWELGGENGFDQELLDTYRIYTRLHLRLFPYEWTYAKRLAEDGRPIQRALGLAHPELGVHPSDTYLFGDSLLVAPVVERGQTERSVALPEGGWVDWWTGEVLLGGQTVTVAAPLETLPLFVAAGSIVPMLRPTIDAMAPTSEPARVDSYATSPGVLWARVAPGPASSFVVFDGSELAQEPSAERIALSSKSGDEFAFGTMFEVVALGAKPAGATMGGVELAELATLEELEAAESGWTFDSQAGGTAYVKVGPGEQGVELLLE